MIKNEYIKSVFHLIVISILTLPAIGCPGITPHKNFKAHLYHQIGRSLDEIPPYEAPIEKELIDSMALPNGNIENKYKHYRGNCFYIFEIDPKTRKIVGARFEGSEKDCVINP